MTETCHKEPQGTSNEGMQERIYFQTIDTLTTTMPTLATKMGQHGSFCRGGPGLTFSNNDTTATTSIWQVQIKNKRHKSQSIIILVMVAPETFAITNGHVPVAHWTTHPTTSHAVLVKKRGHQTHTV